MTQWLSLCDGRQVAISRVQIRRSMGTVLEGSVELVRKHVLRDARDAMGRNGEGTPAAYVVTPEWGLPEWQVEVELRSAPLLHADPDDERWDDWVEPFSSVVMVFFCDNPFGASLTDLVAEQLSDIDEKLWTEHAIDWRF